MTKCNSDSINNDNNSSKMQKSSGDKKLLEPQLVQHRLTETLRNVLNITQNAASQLQSEVLGKRKIKSVARKLTSLTDAVELQSGGPVVTEVSKQRHLSDQILKVCA
jgi:hypothetical protein